jgi:osmotically-inducible protein OsmY
MRLDSDIKRDVEDELSWDPDLDAIDIDAIDIGVTVHNGVVTLGGFVGSSEERVVHECHRRIRTSDRCS